MKVAKMSGAGNDFVLLGSDEATILGSGLVEWVRRVCRRGLSVGADGVVVVERAGVDRLRVRHLNPDGAEAFCGNGTRCAARYARLRGMAGDSMILETAIGEVEARVTGASVRLALPPPADGGNLVIDAGETRFEGRRVAVGVPHFVLFVEDVRVAPLERWGPLLRRHPRFGPEGTNVDLAASRARDAYGVRTWERGVEGETLGCGSGAVAVALAARLKGAPERLRIVPASGVPLFVTLPGEPGRPEEAVLEGDARLVFEGIIGPEGTTGFPA